MGRASRKGGGDGSGLREHWTETHPDRHMWSAGRLAQARTQTLEEYEALYGRGEYVPLEVHYPDLFPTDLLIPDPMSTKDRWKIIAKMDVPAGTTVQDFLRNPFVENLWQAELQRLQAEAERYEAVLGQQSIQHWIRDWEEDPRRMKELRDTWKGSILTEHARTAEGPELVFEGATGGERLTLRPSSALAASRECPSGGWGEANLIRQLHILQKNDQQEYKRFIDESILPEFEYLAQPRQLLRDSQPYVASGTLAKELWSVARFEAGEEKEPGGEFAQIYLQEVLWNGSETGGEDYAMLFSDHPISAQDSHWRDMIEADKPDTMAYPDLYQEAAARINSAALQADPKAEVARVRRTILTDQLMRIGYGLERNVSGDPYYPRANIEKEVQEDWQSWTDRSPLENFRPLFEGEKEDFLFAKILDHYKDCHDPLVYHWLRQELGRNIQMPEHENFSRQIYEALMQVRKKVQP